jgi:hypothetical protein
MAITNLQLNVRANTARALTDFKRFSANLDNQFLVSGLKLDVVRSALSQINREFQKSIGEQGLIGASSLRAAQNQAALLTQVFKGFSNEASLSISTQLGTALNNVAVKAGGTMKDVQRTLAATPFISKNLPEDLRQSLTTGILAFQRDFRRAGIGDNFGGLAQQFLSGKVMGRDLVNSGDPMSAFLGSELIKRAGGQGFIDSPARRTELLMEIVNDPQTIAKLKEMAKRAAGFRIVLEDLNTQLFNTESGTFGSLRKVIDRFGKQTTMFDEVDKLINQVFGPSGLFKTLFSSIKEIFGIGDPLRPLIDAIQFMTGIFAKITEYFKSEQFKTILFLVKDTFQRVVEFFTNVYNSVRQAIPDDAFARITGFFKEIRDQIASKNFDPANIISFIEGIGKGVREYIQKIGKSIRERDDTKEMGFVAEIGASLLTEVGKTAIVLIKELFLALVDKVPEIATAVLPSLNKGINSLLTEAFGEVGGKIVKFIAGFLPGPLGAVARASAVGDVTGGGGNMFSALAMGAGALLGPSMLARMVTRRGRLSTINSLANRAEAFENRLNRSLFLEGVNPVSRSLRYRRQENLLTRVGGFNPGFNYGFDPYRSRYTGTISLDQLNPYLSGFLPNNPPVNRRNPPGGFWPFGRGGGPRPPGGGGSGGGGFWPFGRGGGPRPSGGGPIVNPLLVYDNHFMDRRSMMQRLHERRGYDYSRRGYRQYSDPIGPAPRPERGVPIDWNSGWAFAGLGQGYEGGHFDPYMRSYASSFAERMPTPAERTRAINERYMQRYGMRGRMAMVRRNLPRLGRGALIGGALAGAGALGLGIFGGPGAQAAQSGSLEAAGSVLSGGFEGAMLGATIGSIVPGIGTAAGAVIGGVIGGVAPLMDKGVRDKMAEFLDSIGQGFRNTWNTFTRGIGDLMNWAGKGLENAFKGLVNGIVGFLNAALSTATAIPRAITTMVQALYESAPGWVKDRMPGAGSFIQSAVDATSYQIPKPFYKGKNYAGPTLALEERMSGRNAMVVNDGEFVIPNNGLATLSNLVGQNLRNREVVTSSGGPTQININLTVQTSAFFADAEQIARELKQPVITIIDEAWKEYADVQNVMRSKVS